MGGLATAASHLPDWLNDQLDDMTDDMVNPRKNKESVKREKGKSALKGVQNI